MANKEHTSTRCRNYRICGRAIEGNSADGSCILHSTDPAKDDRAFAEALILHRERHGDNFTWFVFPEDTDFMMKWFSEGANFFGATFTGDISFYEARFRKSVSFSLAKFNKRVNFSGARFFSDSTQFHGATFSGGADFGEVTFSEGADFGEVTFSGYANFSGATFSGRTLFGGRPGNTQTGRIFADTAVDFRQVVINPPDAITFLGADLTTCQFLDTDLRKVQLVDIEWPKRRRRVLVYDEIRSVTTRDRDGDGDEFIQSLEQIDRERRQGIEQLDREFRQNDESDSAATGDGDGDEDTQPWPQLERLYRELKQNCEDRRDYERAGDFHYGEKEMRRKNPDTALGLRVFLALYRLFSGYGERYLRPLFWAGVLFAVSTIGYWWCGLYPKAGGAKLAWASVSDWLQGVDYSFRVMTLLKPDDWEPVGYARYVRTLQTLLGPLFLGLFALALRQRLKR